MGMAAPNGIGNDGPLAMGLLQCDHRRQQRIELNFNQHPSVCRPCTGNLGGLRIWRAIGLNQAFGLRKGADFIVELGDVFAISGLSVPLIVEGSQYIYLATVYGDNGALVSRLQLHVREY